MKQIPPHLKKYVANQHYDQYTPINHAVWRYVMRQNHHVLKDRAHPAYAEGLRSSGIVTEHIPRVSEMNDCLAKIGWGAVIVNGLIPGAVFYELLASGILPIAAEIRKLTNIEYTPAPDIIHEAAGHAPILFDPEYRAYVQQIGEIGTKAFSMKERGEAFEALRQLTIVMEDPNSTDEEKAAAQLVVLQKQQAVVGLSEAEQVSRLFWATVEYGLIGEVDHPRIYGAGLLSSVGESKHCFTDAVTKLPYSVEACAASPKVVTEMQSKLFVCSSFDELKAGAEALASTMAYRVGGTESLEKAKNSKQVATFEFNSGLCVTGIVHEVVTDQSGEAVYVRTTGETALSANNQQLLGHGTDYHAKGFGTPIGQLTGGIALESCDDAGLAGLGIVDGNEAKLDFASGVVVSGRVKKILRVHDALLLISFEDCTVTLVGRELFKSEWGTYDMAVGSRIVSAYPGAADLERAEPAKEQEQQEREGVESVTLNELEQLYQQTAVIRAKQDLNEQDVKELTDIYQKLTVAYPSDWLLRMELLELTIDYAELSLLETPLREELQELSQAPSLTNLIMNGLAVLEV
ncbi:aromatic amino acid hydroxylase [Paenibacillus albus]|uniref:Aromatic amino acid hydroxylase n=1 Tax=Paenibacillus albus TaxID=2495582 RepID=A0A3S9A612_9BACL|nr:aromatic amino acid hydroxylase [Paenibacillus albus]AZN41187.1 aromatic amino acid hydroxylase [Paenibacillus albus]